MSYGPRRDAGLRLLMDDMNEIKALFQKQSGMIGALLLALQVVIAKHPDKRGIIETLKGLSEDAPDIVAMNAPGMTVLDTTFRELLAAILASAESGRPSHGNNALETLTANTDILMGAEAVHDLVLRLLLADRYRGNLTAFDREMAALRSVAESKPRNETHASEEALEEYQVNMLAQLDVFLSEVRAHLVAVQPASPGKPTFRPFGTGS